MYDIIVIGGGAAGLMAAKLLSAKDKKVLLIEARKDLGGRICRSKDFLAEGGAEFIHGNLKTTFALLKEAHLKKEKVKGHFCRVESGNWKVNDDIIPHWDRLLKTMKDCKKDTTVEDFLQRYFHAEKYDKLRRQFTKYVEGYDAADIKDASMFAIRKEMEEEDELQYRPRPDYFALIDFLKNECLACNTEIKTNEPVLKITRGKDIEVITPVAKYICRKIIIAVPLGILKCSPKSKGFITFPRSLKAHIDAAKTIGNGGVIKFSMQFDEPFWLDKKFLRDRNIPPPSFILTDTMIPTWWTQYPSPNPLLTGWLGGPASHKLKNYSEKKLKKVAIESLSSVFLIPVVHLENKLKTCSIINWINEPYILGGYSYSTLPAEKGRALLAQPVENCYYFAGEYAIENSLSTVDAALQSGKKVAEKILKDE